MTRCSACIPAIETDEVTILCEKGAVELGEIIDVMNHDRPTEEVDAKVENITDDKPGCVKVLLRRHRETENR